MKVKNPRLVKQILEEGAPLELLRQLAPDLPLEKLVESQELLRQPIWPEDVFNGVELLIQPHTPAQRALLERL
jgi:hypothetical protein